MKVNPFGVRPFGIHKKTGAPFVETLDITRKLGLTLAAKVKDVEPLLDREGALAIAPYTGTYARAREFAILLAAPIAISVFAIWSTRAIVREINDAFRTVIKMRNAGRFTIKEHYSMRTLFYHHAID